MESGQSGQGLTRREVLQAAAGAGVLALGSGEALPFQLSKTDSTFVWFSDTHVGVNRGYDENLAMLRQIRRTVRPDFVINGGDITDYGWQEEYDRYSELLKALPFKVHHVPGNHDVRWSPLGMTIYRKQVGQSYSKLNWNGVTILLLDTTVPLSHWGSINSQQMDWLSRELESLGREAPVILGMHHWPGRDRKMVDNEEELARMVEPYNVKLILTGHGHSDLNWEWNGAACTMCKGLYQGSWQTQTLESDQLVVRRATGATGALAEVTRVPLKSSRSKQKLYPVPLACAAPLGEISLLRNAKEVSWKRDVWVSASEALAAPKIPGSYRVGLRGAEGPSSVRVEVRSDDSKLQPEWSTPLDGGVLSHVVVEEGVAYISTLAGGLYALDAKTGRRIWRANMQGGSLSTPLLAGGLVWVGAEDHHLYAFDRTSGALVRRTETGGPVHSSPAAAKGIVAVGSGDGMVHGVSQETGKTLWKTLLAGGSHAFVQSRLATDGARFFAGAWDNNLYAFDAVTGAIAWKAACCGDMSFLYSPAIGGPLVADGRVIVPANGNRLYCFDAVTGEQKWVTTSPGDKFGYSSPKLIGGRVVIGCLGDKGEFRCLSLETGEILWTCVSGEVIYDSSPCGVGDGVAILSTSGLLTLASLGSGEILAQHRLPAGLATSSPGGFDGGLVTATNNRMAVGFRVAG